MASTAYVTTKRMDFILHTVHWKKSQEVVKRSAMHSGCLRVLLHIVRFYYESSIVRSQVTGILQEDWVHALHALTSICLLLKNVLGPQLSE